MAEHRIALSWNGGDAPFTYDAYPRNHKVAFKNGAEHLSVSASPAYKGDAAMADPEDLLVAALSSCHMLSFLAIACKRKFVVARYEDEAVGTLENSGGKLWLARVILRPKVVFSGAIDDASIADIHHLAHEACFIANSVKTEVVVAPR